MGTNLIVDISKDSLPGRTHLRIVERTFGFGQCLLEHAEIQFLYLVFRSQHFLLVGILLLQLLVFQLCHVVAQFGLAHLIGSTRTETVEVLLVAQLHLHAVQLHGGDFDFHLQVGQLGLVVKFQLFQLVAAHLLFVQHLLVVGFGTL